MVSFVLVHGGAHGAWCWDRLIPFLEHPALAIDLPGRGSSPADLGTVTTDDWADAVTERVESVSGEVVLVGHSLAGITLPRVADRVSKRLAHLVWISCSVPPEGKATLDVLSAEIAPIAAAARENSEGSTLPEAIARQMFCNDMNEKQARFVLDRLVPEAWGPMLEPTKLAGLSHGVPSTYVRLLQDVTVTPELQDSMIATLRGCAPCDVVELDSGHNVMVSQPEALARVLNEIAAGS
jgi:pimeloyl-ACP methyl ester carboxylesterase